MRQDFIDEISRELHLPYKYINGHEYRVRNCDLHGFVSIKDIQKTQNLNILNFFSNNFFDDDVEIDYVVSKYLNKDMTAEEAMNRLTVYYLNLINSGRG
jgi:hypothetical protein